MKRLWHQLVKACSGHTYSAAVTTARMAQGQNRITPVLREDEIESASDPIGVSAASMDIIRWYV